MEKIIDYIAAVFGAFIGFFIGGCDGLCYALLTFIVVDYITGVLCAISEKNLSSAVGFKGISKKVLMIILVGVANVIDMQLLKKGAVLRTATIFFYIANEGVSILENSTKLGLPLPKKLKDVLVQFSDSRKSDESSEGSKNEENDIQ